MSAKGERIADKIPAANFMAWWDGDLLREIVDHEFDAAAGVGVPTISKWNWETESSDRLLTATGARTNNHTKGNPSLQADLLGDWREELAFPSSDSTELRIYTSTSPTEVRLRTLMHEPCTGPQWPAKTWPTTSRRTRASSSAKAWKPRPRRPSATWPRSGSARAAVVPDQRTREAQKTPV